MRTSVRMSLLAILVLSCTGSIFAQEDLWYRLSIEIISFCEQGRYVEATTTAEKALRVAENTFGSDDSRVALSLNNLALLYASQERYTEAESLFKRALDIWEQLSIQDHPGAAQPPNRPVALHEIGSKYENAESLWKQTPPVDEKVLEQVHTDLPDVDEKMTRLYDRMQSKSVSMDTKMEPAISAPVAEERARGEKGKVVRGGREQSEIETAKAEHFQIVTAKQSKDQDIAKREHPSDRYSVNVASFRKRTNAERLMNELKKKGYTVSVVETIIPQRGLWYRVALGRFPSLKEARGVARAFKKREGTDCFLTLVE